MRPRILVSAYGCEPGKGSEQGVGWNWVIELSQIADLVVITRRNNRNSIEAANGHYDSHRLRFIYFDLSDSIQLFKRQERGLYGYYMLWQWGAFRNVKKILKQESFDYVMHLSFGSIWLPTFMHRLPVPFIWGPIGGGEAVPWPLIRSLPVKARLSQYIRHLLIATFRFNPLYLRITRKAKVILARTNDTAILFRPRYKHKIFTILETAISETLVHKIVRRDNPTIESEQITAIYTGRLIGLKNLGMAIAAVSISRKLGCNVKLIVVGDGPLRSELESTAARFDVSDAIIFKGKLSQDEVISELAKSDIYLFPSLKEGGAWSLMEAMAVGLPVICVETSGMAVVTDDESAIRVKPGQPDIMVNDFANALVTLANSASLRKAMGGKAKDRIEKHFRWHHKRQFMHELLSQLGNNAI